MMNCNQPFYNVGFTNVPYCGSYNSNHQTPNISPTIIGEGELSSVTLPDGSIQYFFIPTLKWWTPFTPNTCPPHFMNATNTNYSNPYYNSNMGVWFIRSILNPCPAFANNTCETPYRGTQRCERRPFCSDYDMNCVKPEYQLKFHHDGATSTTDIHYFYPCLRQYDCTFNFPPKSCAAVQIDTPAAATCQNKPPSCKHPDCTCQEYGSNESCMIVNKSKENICNCALSDNESRTDCCKTEQRRLTPPDDREKRIKLNKKPPKKNKSKRKVKCKCAAESMDKNYKHPDCTCQQDRSNESCNIGNTSKDNICNFDSSDNESTTDCCKIEQRRLTPTDDRRKRIKLDKKPRSKQNDTCKCAAQSVDKSTAIQICSNLGSQQSVLNVKSDMQ